MVNGCEGHGHVVEAVAEDRVMKKSKESVKNPGVSGLRTWY